MELEGKTGREVVRMRSKELDETRSLKKSSTMKPTSLFNKLGRCPYNKIDWLWPGMRSRFQGGIGIGGTNSTGVSEAHIVNQHTFIVFSPFPALPNASM